MDTQPGRPPPPPRRRAATWSTTLIRANRISVTSPCARFSSFSRSIDLSIVRGAPAGGASLSFRVACRMCEELLLDGGGRKTTARTTILCRKSETRLGLPHEPSLVRMALPAGAVVALLTPGKKREKKVSPLQAT